MFSPDSIQPVRTVGELLAHVRATQDLDRPALTFFRGADPTGTLSYAEYLDRIGGWAAYLRQQGLGRGDRMATLLRNRLEVPVLYLAAMSVGVVVVPLNPSYTPAEMAFVLDDARPSLVLTDVATGGERLDELARVGAVRIVDDVVIDAPPLAPDEAVQGDDPAIILYTSGTTSFPKGVEQMHRNLTANAWSMVKALRIEQPVQYSVMPFYHAHAVGFGMMTCLLSSGHLLVTERMVPFVWAKVIAAEGVTVTSMVPSMLQLLLRMRVTREVVPTLRFLFVSAAPLPVEVAREFETGSGIPLAHAWGLSEFTNFATILPPDTDPAVRRAMLFGRSTPSVGYALDGVRVEVVRPDGTLCEPEELGELRVQGPSATLGYHGNPEATAAAFRSGWLHTGDEGYRMVASGVDYFFVTDRIKDIIIRSGEKISPAAVEAAVVADLPELAGRVVVLGYPHDTYGEEIGLVVEADDPSPFEDRLMKTLANLPVRMRPKVVLHGEGVVPRTHTGKTQRRLLVDHFAGYRRSGHEAAMTRILPG